MAREDRPDGTRDQRLPLSPRIERCIDTIGDYHGLRKVLPRPRAKKQERGYNTSEVVSMALKRWNGAIREGEVLDDPVILRYAIEYLYAVNLLEDTQDKRLYLDENANADLEAVVESLQTWKFVPMLTALGGRKTPNYRLIVVMAVFRYAEKLGLRLPPIGY